MFKGRLLKKSSKIENRSLSCQCRSTRFSNFAFHLWLIWLQTLITIDSKSRKRSFPSFCAQLFEVVAESTLTRCTIWLESEKTAFSRIGRRFRSAGSELADLFLCPIFTQRVTDQWMIEKLFRIKKTLFDVSEKKWLVNARNLQSIEPFDSWTKLVSQEW